MPDWLKNLAPILLLLAAISVVVSRLPKIDLGHSEAFKIPDMVARGLMPDEYLVGPQDLVRVLPSPDVINIVVCGDPDRNRVMVLWGGYVSPVTRKIEALL